MSDRFAAPAVPQRSGGGTRCVARNRARRRADGGAAWYRLAHTATRCAWVGFRVVPVVLTLLVGLISTCFFRKTGTVWTGAFVSDIFVTWSNVASQATHFAF